MGVKFPCSTYQHLRLIFPKYGNVTDNGDFHGSTACANVKSKLEGHSESITSLAFPSLLNLPVFVAADDQCDKWIRKMQFPERRSTGKLSETKVQFQQDQKHFLVMHELKLAVFETIKLECVVGRFGRFWLRSHMQHFMQ